MSLRLKMILQMALMGLQQAGIMLAMLDENETGNDDLAARFCKYAADGLNGILNGGKEPAPFITNRNVDTNRTTQDNFGN